MTTLNPFATLGITPGASEIDIKKSFRKMALAWHPDKNPHRKDEATKKFQDINDAYKELIDTKTRREAELKWNVSAKTASSTYYYSTPSSSSRGGWSGYRDDPFPEYTTWGGGFYKQQQPKTSKTRSKNSAYSHYAQKDSSNRYAYETPTGSKYKQPKTKPKPKTETKPKPEFRQETKPKPKPRQETKPNVYETPPQFKSTAGDPQFNRKTGYSYTSGERYRPGETPNVKPPVYDEPDGSTPFNFERQRHPHSSSGKGEKFKMYDEPPAKDKPTSGTFNFTMPDMKTSEPSPSAKSYRENHSFVFDQDDESSEGSDYDDEDLPDPQYRETPHPFFNQPFVDLTNDDEDVQELSPDEYREIAKEAQRKKEQERMENERERQQKRDMFGNVLSSSSDDEVEVESEDSDDENMFGGGSQSSFFGSQPMFASNPFDKSVLEDMFNFSLGGESPQQSSKRRRPTASHRQRRGRAYPKKPSPESSKPLFDLNNVHPFNETHGNFGMDEIRSNIDQMGGDKVKTEKTRPVGEEDTGRFRRQKNTTSEPVNTSSSSAFKGASSSAYTKLNIDLATDLAQHIVAPEPPSCSKEYGEDDDTALARYLRDFHQYQQDMDLFSLQCLEYRKARMVANETHKNALISSATNRRANIEAREIDALVLEKEYIAIRKHAEALEKFDEVSNNLR